MKDLKIETKEGTEVLVVREGAAAVIHEVQDLAICGSISAPADFLEIRREQFPTDGSHVIVNEDSGTITLNANDRDEIGEITITGAVKIHPDFLRIGINDPAKVRQPKDLATFIKMNRTLFESKETANNLISELRNFKAKIEKQVEDSSDDRANYTTKVQQAVESNLPDTFKVTVPIFIGEKAVTFAVEVVIDSEDFSCMLISPDAADILKREKKAMLDEQLKHFDGYVIINQ